MPTSLHHAKRLKNVFKSEQPVQMLFRNSQNTEDNISKWSQTFSVKGEIQNDLQSTLVVKGSHTREAGHVTTVAPTLYVTELQFVR